MQKAKGRRKKSTEIGREFPFVPSGFLERISKVVVARVFRPAVSGRTKVLRYVFATFETPPYFLLLSSGSCSFSNLLKLWPTARQEGVEAFHRVRSAAGVQSLRVQLRSGFGSEDPPHAIDDMFHGAKRGPRQRGQRPRHVVGRRLELI